MIELLNFGIWNLVGIIRLGGDASFGAFGAWNLDFN
jgi:hypothetical protein